MPDQKPVEKPKTDQKGNVEPKEEPNRKGIPETPKRPEKVPTER